MSRTTTALKRLGVAGSGCRHDGRGYSPLPRYGAGRARRQPTITPGRHGSPLPAPARPTRRHHPPTATDHHRGREGQRHPDGPPRRHCADQRTSNARRRAPARPGCRRDRRRSGTVVDAGTAGGGGSVDENQITSACTASRRRHGWPSSASRDDQPARCSVDYDANNDYVTLATAHASPPVATTPSPSPDAEPAAGLQRRERHAGDSPCTDQGCRRPPVSGAQVNSDGGSGVLTRVPALATSRGLGTGQPDRRCVGTDHGNNASGGVDVTDATGRTRTRSLLRGQHHAPLARRAYVPAR